MNRQRRKANARSANRELLSNPQADTILRDLRRGSIRRVADVALPFPGWRLDRLSGVTFENVELSISAHGGWRSRGEWRDCSVAGSRLDPLVLVKCRVSSCTFTDCDIGYEDKPGFVDATFEDCQFRSSAFAQISVQRCAFTRVRFEDVRLERPMWRNCDFVDVVMTGNSIGGHFVECDFTRSDLSAMTLQHVTIIDTRASDVAIPATDASFLVTRADLAAAIAACEAQMSPAGREAIRELRALEGPWGENALDFRLKGAASQFWNSELLGQIYDLDPSDAQMLVDWLRDRRLSKPPSRDIRER